MSFSICLTKKWQVISFISKILTRIAFHVFPRSSWYCKLLLQIEFASHWWPELCKLWWAYISDSSAELRVRFLILHGSWLSMEALKSPTNCQLPPNAAQVRFLGGRCFEMAVFQSLPTWVTQKSLISLASLGSLTKLTPIAFPTGKPMRFKTYQNVPASKYINNKLNRYIYAITRLGLRCLYIFNLHASVNSSWAGPTSRLWTRQSSLFARQAKQLIHKPGLAHKT